MANMTDITEHLNSLLQVQDYEDASHNGLQVQGPDEVKKIGFAVDACLATFKQAIEKKCQLLIVHHGLIWGDGLGKLTGSSYERIKALIKGELGLYAVHLPLDAHPRYGNNAELARLIGLKNIKPFGTYREKAIGFSGKLKRQQTLKELAQLLKATIGAECRIFPFGRAEDEPVSTAGIISGGGSDGIGEAAELGLDVFITGEIKHSTFHYAKEGNVSIIEAGHYTTETLGLQALRPVLEKRFKVKTIFLDEPTGL